MIIPRAVSTQEKKPRQCCLWGNNEGKWKFFQGRALEAILALQCIWKLSWVLKDVLDGRVVKKGRAITEEKENAILPTRAPNASVWSCYLLLVINYRPEEASHIPSFPPGNSTVLFYLIVGLSSTPPDSHIILMLLLYAHPDCWVAQGLPPLFLRQRLV